MLIKIFLCLLAVALSPVAFFILRSEARRAALRWREYRRIERLKAAGVVRMETGLWVLDPPCNACGRVGCLPRWHHEPGITAVVEFLCEKCGATFAHKAISEQLGGVKPEAWSDPDRKRLVGPEVGR